jgi:putative phosphoesterase
MDIGIISDIHGDIEALEEVIDRLDNIHEVDHVLCAGDLIGRGPEEDRVVEMIRARSIPTVCGNHDEFVHGLMRHNRDYLKNLPVDWQGEYDGVRIFMCHGKPGSNAWGLYRDHASDTLLNMMLNSLQADVLITGHTHLPLYVRVNNGCVINPGSVYTFKSMRSTSHTYGVLHLDNLSFDLYDVTKEPLQPLSL